MHIILHIIRQVYYWRDNNFRSVCRRGNSNDKHESNQSRPRKGHKKKHFHEVNEEKNESIDDLPNQVQSLFYHDVHFNMINTKMYTEIECKTPNGEVWKQTFKVIAGADGNLKPITMFMKLFPKISLKILESTIESGVNLYAYNNTPIKWFGAFSVHLNFKGRSAICKFYMIENSTAILGVTNSERLGLVKVNFGMTGKSSSVKLVHNVTSDSFKNKIETEFLDLF